MVQTSRRVPSGPGTWSYQAAAAPALELRTVPLVFGAAAASSSSSGSQTSESWGTFAAVAGARGCSPDSRSCRV